MKFIIKNYDYELISCFLFLGVVPFIVTHFYCAICILFNTNKFTYPLPMLYFELLLLFICLLVVCLICLLSKKIVFKSDDNAIYFDDLMIIKKNIQKMNYVSFHMILLPFLYFIKKSNGMIMEIEYFSEKGTYKKYSMRISPKVYNKIKETL